MQDAETKLRWAVLFALSLLAAGLETVGAGAVFALVEVVSSGDGSTQPASRVGKLLSGWLPDDRLLMVMVLCGGTALFFVLKNLFLIFHLWYQERVAQRATIHMSGNLMRQYLSAPYTFHLGRNSAELIRNLTQCSEDVSRVLLLGSMTVITETCLMLGVLAALLLVDPLMTLGVGGVLGVTALATMRATQRGYEWRGRRLVQLHALLLQHVTQALGSIKEITILGREPYFHARFLRILGERTQQIKIHSVIGGAPRMINELVMVLGIMLVLLGAALRGENMQVVAPLLGLFGYAGYRLMPSLNRIVQQLNNLRFGFPSGAVIRKDLDELAAQAEQTTEQPVALGFRSELALRDVSYRYPGAAVPALSGVNLTIPRGGIIGIVGPTGAGKSTLVDLILGLYQPQQGAVTVDGVDIAGHLREWRRHIGYVPQAIALVDDTLRRNVAIGLPDEEIEEARLWRALERAQLDDFVRALPDGLETMVGERGVRLSGGQRQRIGVARALYGDPEVLVFDEATSALDVSTEAEISREIDSLAGQVTVILIAHRLATLRNCDRLVYLEGGRILGSGTFAELARTCDGFHRMLALDGNRGGPLDPPPVP